MNLQKLFLLGAVVAMTIPTYAQKAKVKQAVKALNSAKTAAEKGQAPQALLALNQAKSAIDDATKDDETKDDAKTWITKATIYVSLQDNDNSGDKPYIEAYDALQKAFELDSKIKTKEDAVQATTQVARYAFSDGVDAFNKNDYSNALEDMNRVDFLLGQPGDKRYASTPAFDTVRTQAQMLAGFSAYYSDQPETAIQKLEPLAGNPMMAGNAPNVYLILANAYEKTNQTAKQLDIIKKGLAAFPDNENLKSAEVNYYIATGNLDELRGKLEKETQDNPDDPKAFYNLGLLYDQLANPKDGSSPANKAEYTSKAQTNLDKALSLSPDDPQMNYNLAIHYYNQAADVNGKLQKMDGTESNYISILNERNGLFVKAVPLFEKAKSIYQPKVKYLSGNDKVAYARTLQALSQIYAIQNKMDKADENDKLLEEMK